MELEEATYRRSLDNRIGVHGPRSNYEGSDLAKRTPRRNRISPNKHPNPTTMRQPKRTVARQEPDVPRSNETYRRSIPLHTRKGVDKRNRSRTLRNRQHDRRCTHQKPNQREASKLRWNDGLGMSVSVWECMDKWECEWECEWR